MEDTNNRPEDSFLDDLVRNLKWKAAQQQKASHFRQRLPQLTDIRLVDEDDYAEQDDKISFQPKIEQLSQHQQDQKNFAYRPHDDRFRNHHPPQPVRQIKTFNPLIQPPGTNLVLMLISHFFLFLFWFVVLRTKEAILRSNKVNESNGQPLICDRVLYSLQQNRPFLSK